MFITLIQIVLGLSLLYVGGELLVKGAVSIGRSLGLSSLLLGLTVVAFGTSAPELAVSLDAAITGRADIAVANVVGSNIANIGLVAALIMTAGRMRASPELVRRDLPAMIIAFCVMTAFLGNFSLNRIEGALLVVLLGVYSGYLFRNHSRRAGQSVPVDNPPPLVPFRWMAVVQVLAGVALLAFGGDQLVSGASGFAAMMGVSEAVIGLTMVAVGTSLPEIATSVIAARKGHAGMAIGNIVGSNIWNSLGVLGTTALVVPIRVTGIEWHMLLAMAAFGLVFWWLLSSSRGFRPFHGLVLLIAYFSYQYTIF